VLNLAGKLPHHPIGQHIREHQHVIVVRVGGDIGRPVAMQPAHDLRGGQIERWLADLSHYRDRREFDHEWLKLVEAQVRADVEQCSP